MTVDLKRIAIAAAFLLAVAPAIPAQNRPHLPTFDQPMPTRAQVLKMGYARLCDWAYAHAPDMNELQADNLAMWYANLREAENRRIFRNENLERATHALRQWASARWHLMYLQAGGGTLYIHASVRESALIADLEADAIRGWNGRGKENAADVVRSFAAMYPDRKTPGGTSTAAFRKALVEEQRRLEALTAALRRLPAEPQRLYADLMVRLVKERFE